MYEQNSLIVSSYSLFAFEKRFPLLTSLLSPPPPLITGLDTAQSERLAHPRFCSKRKNVFDCDNVSRLNCSLLHKNVLGSASCGEVALD